MKAEDWGTSKVSGFFGAFFGGTGSGIKNAFKNAGKWALIGAGVGGLIGLLPGAIIGGLLGAAFGGILGYIGGETLAKSFDGIGAWFQKQFDKLILGPIKAVWDFIAPDWAKSVTDTMQWSDLLPPGLTKLFNGEYFTFDMPEFTWTDIFPGFLVDFFTNVTKVVGATSWSWMDLLPPFLTKFFTGAYAPGKEEFKWQDLVPEFIWKVIEVAKTAWADTPFTWRRAFQLNGPVLVASAAPAATKSDINFGTKSIQENSPVCVNPSMILRMKVGTKLLHVNGVSAHAVFATSITFQINSGTKSCHLNSSLPGAYAPVKNFVRNGGNRSIQLQDVAPTTLVTLVKKSTRNPGNISVQVNTGISNVKYSPLKSLVRPGGSRSLHSILSVTDFAQSGAMKSHTALIGPRTSVSNCL
jgi:hypothetical protein